MTCKKHIKVQNIFVPIEKEVTKIDKDGNESLQKSMKVIMKVL